MNTWQHRTVYSVFVLAALMLGYAVVYDYGMPVSRIQTNEEIAHKTYIN